MPAPGPDHRRTTCRRWGLCVPRSGTHGPECNAATEYCPCPLFDGGGRGRTRGSTASRRGSLLVVFTAWAVIVGFAVRHYPAAAGSPGVRRGAEGEAKERFQ